MAKILGIDKDFPLSEMYKQRPRIVDVDDAKVRIEKYFAMCAKFGYSPQYTGLVLVLGLEKQGRISTLTPRQRIQRADKSRLQRR